MTEKRGRGKARPPAPPSPRKLEEIKASLRRCLPLDMACAIAGFKARNAVKWLELGYAGDPEYVPFYEMWEEAKRELAEPLWDEVVNQAFKERSLAALQMLYKARLQDDDNRLAKKIAAMQDRVDANQAEASAGTAESPEDLAELEAKLIAEKEAGLH